MLRTPDILKVAKISTNLIKSNFKIKKRADLDLYNLIRMKLLFKNCAADFSLLNLPKGKSLGRSKPATNS